MQTTRRFLAVLVLSVVCGGCVSSLERISDAVAGVEKYQSRDELRFDAQNVAAQSAKGRSQQPVNVLALSGGGAWGAWGAGFLIGWRDSPADPRPDTFDIVTGISTGALQATAAFIGDDEILRQGYTRVDRSDIMRLRFPPYLSALWSPSIYDTSPLADLITTLFTNEVIDRVAAQAGPDGLRRLYVATCELDSGDLVFWDLTNIARDKQYDLYRSVVYASAAIPAGFQPVHIGGKLHVDGGTRASLFFDESVLKSLRINNPDLRIYAIVNGRTVIDPITPTNRTLPTAFRSVAMVLSSQTWNNLRQIYRIGQNERTLVWVSTVPPEYKTQAEHDFDPAEMKRLFDEGLKHASGNEWQFVKAPNQKPYFGTQKMQTQLQRAD